MITIDEARGVLRCNNEGQEDELPLSSPEAFRIISQAWLRCGWDTKYVYSFSWLGRPIIQLPEDMVRIQEVIYQIRPDVIIETGVAHGGSLVYYASLCKLLGAGRVIGVDIEIRPHNRTAIEAHPLTDLITLIEGSSTDPDVLATIRGTIAPDDRVLVLLDSNHTKSHVLGELEAYGPLVSPGSYIVATDGIMRQVAGAPRTGPDWEWNNPIEAVHEFLARHPQFAIVEPPFPFNEGVINERVTYWPEGFLKRVA
jgi:cephalosporin hydroxylase